jgi:hypothetical protein
VNIERVLQWLDCVGEDLTLVGGQAVALWETVLGLPVITETVDIDFLGDASQALGLADALNYRCRIPQAQDPTPNTAILIDDAGVVVADFLAYVAGLNETDILRRRVPMTTANGHSFFVLHPFDCLASRLSNIMLIPGKRTPRGYDQLRAAIRVCHGYLLRLIAEGKAHEAIKIANRVFDLALTDAGKRTFFHHGIDLLDALPPPAAFGVEAFEHENHPRQVQRVRLQREQFARFLARYGNLNGDGPTDNAQT